MKAFSCRAGALLILLAFSPRAGWSASGPVIYSNNFEDRLGSELTASDVRVESTPRGRSFLGQFGNDEVTLRLSDLTPHTRVRVAFDLFIIRSWDGDGGGRPYGPDYWELKLPHGRTILRTTFANGQAQQHFPDPPGPVLHPPQTDALEVNSLGYGGTSGDSVYRIVRDFEHSGGSLALTFAAWGLEDIANESWGLDNVTIELDGQQVYAADFENGPASGWSHLPVEISPTGRRFIGQFGNETLTLSLSDLPVHSELSVAFQLFLIRSWDGSGPQGGGPDIWTVRADGGPALIYSTFRNGSGDQSYPGNHPDAHNSGKTGSAEQNTLGYTYNDRAADVVYWIHLRIPHRENTLRLSLAAIGLEPIDNESWGIDDLSIVAGEASPFASSVLRYDPESTGGPAPTGQNDPTMAFGNPEGGAVSLGNGGFIELELGSAVMNSGDSTPELMVYENGYGISNAGVEDALLGLRPHDRTTAQAVSGHCVREDDEFCDLTRIGTRGFTRWIDLDQLLAGHLAGELTFDAVRLTDVRGDGIGDPRYVGIDLDAVAVAAAPQFSLKTFPLRKSRVSAYTARVTSVLDHSGPFTARDDRIRTFWAEEAQRREGALDCPPTGGQCEYRRSVGQPSQRVNYAGASGGTRYLSYDGHAGYDYGYREGTPIVAPRTGRLCLATQDPVNGRGRQATAWDRFHTFYIDHGVFGGRGYSTWYLHSQDLSERLRGLVPGGPCAEVEEGQPIAEIGDYCGGCDVDPHLHFEVRTYRPEDGPEASSAKSLDPYGWWGSASDPIGDNPQAILNPDPLWPDCSDGIVDPAEECDDGNQSDDDGCARSCRHEPGWDCTDRAESSAPSRCIRRSQASPGDVVSTDLDEGGATFEEPVEVAVVATTAGTIEIARKEQSTAPPAGLTAIDPGFVIVAPPGSPLAPLQIVFSLHSSILPTTRPAVILLRNNLAVPACNGTNPELPCIASYLVHDDETEIRVQTVAASDWSFAVAEQDPTACTGDCGLDGTVTVDEVLTMVNVALGNLSIRQCANGDQNGDKEITVDEILQAINTALQGCPRETS